MIVLARGRFGSAPSRVLAQARRNGPMTREDLAQATTLSAATVARTVSALAEEGLLRERQDLVRAGAVGRPSAPLELDPDRFVVLGVHVGKRLTTVGLVDLAGRLVGQTRMPTPPSADGVVSAAARAATDLLSADCDRVVLSAGLVAAWGAVGHEEHDLGAALADATGLAVSTAHHVAAVVAAEYLAKRRGRDGCTAYVYARDTAGFALAHDTTERTEISRVAELAHFPTREEQGCGCGRSGCLEAVASDLALARRAFEQGLLPRQDVELLHHAARAGDAEAQALLHERAEVLGRTAAVLCDMVSPDRVVLVGQAFTGYAPAMDTVAAAFTSSTTRTPIEVSFTRFGTGVQAVAAGTVALGPVYEDPLAFVGRNGSDQTAGRSAHVC